MAQAERNIIHEKKRVAQQQDTARGSRLTGIFFLLMVLAAIIWCGWLVVRWMQDNHRLPLNQLVITGQRHYTTDDDIRRAVLSLGPLGTFVTQNVNVVQQRIAARLPWLKQVSVRKQWPNELKVHVVEYLPAARWNDIEWLDDQGNAFTLPADRVKNLILPALYGPQDTENQVMTEYQTLNKALTQNKLSLKILTMSLRQSWMLTLSNGIRLELGKMDVTARLQRFLELYPILLQQQQQEHKQVSYVDLRYNSGAAVGWSTVDADSEH